MLMRRLREIPQLQSAAQDDADDQQWIQFITAGFPACKSHLPESLQPYRNGPSQLSVDGGLVMKGPRILIQATFAYKFKPTCTLLTMA